MSSRPWAVFGFGTISTARTERGAPDGHARPSTHRPVCRHNGFGVGERAGLADKLDLAIDPKLAWALAHRERFPIDLHRASKEELVRVPGIGIRTAQRLIAMRRQCAIQFRDLVALGVTLRTVGPFVEVRGVNPHRGRLDRPSLRRSMHRPEQIGLFAGR